MEILPIEPGISRRPWGGQRLSALLGAKQGPGEPVGETWHISAHPQLQGKIAGTPLGDNLEGRKMPYLVKLIDTAAALSIQVHPGDEFAKKNENSLGKTECWIILAASKKAGIYLGLKPGVNRESFERLLEENGDIAKCLNFRPVRPGDFFYIPAGTIHAIGENIFLAEVQQSSGITYRVWDWNRTDRELHIEKAMQVINFNPSDNSEETFKIRSGLFDRFGNTLLAEHPDFSLRFCHLKKGCVMEIDLANTHRACSLLTLKGKALLNEKISTGPFQSYLLKGTQLRVKASEEFGFIYVY